jgi:hypothetical protein
MELSGWTSAKEGFAGEESHDGVAERGEVLREEAALAPTVVGGLAQISAAL